MSRDQGGNENFVFRMRNSESGCFSRAKNLTNVKFKSEKKFETKTSHQKVIFYLRRVRFRDSDAKNSILPSVLLSLHLSLHLGGTDVRAEPARGHEDVVIRHDCVCLSVCLFSVIVASL